MKHDDALGAAPATKRRLPAAAAKKKKPSSAAAGAVTPVPANAKPRRPRVLLVFNFCWDDAKAILMGISRYAHGSWEVLIDVQAAAATEDWWVRSQEWDGVITRHMSPSLIEACRARKIPLIDLNDAPLVKDCPKIRPDNHAAGHMG